ncbi:MAG TPA: DUF2203 domain-containing protein [Thermoplasmata archaeon]|nr:DUF2203 domain-containing protein [Thermoplasmata archaeon]
MARSDRPSDTPPPVAPPRLWTAAEANQRLSELAELLPRLRAWAARLAEVHDERERLASFWGSEADAEDQPDHELKSRLDAEWKHLSHRLDEAIGALRAEGIEVKDLASGLVDFYAMESGELVYLCWQHGEASVEYYHTLTGGFRSRRPLPGVSKGPSVRTQTQEQP